MLCNDQAVMPFQCLQMDCNTRVWYVERLSWGPPETSIFHGESSEPLEFPAGFA
jgi:hypothetical protein